MLKIAIIDTIGLAFDGTTVEKRGLGGSESAVSLMAKELAKLNFDVTVYNNCIDSQASPGIYDKVRYIDHSMTDQFEDYHDIVLSSRNVFPFFPGSIYWKFIKNARLKVLWMHDTFCQGDAQIEDMLVDGLIDEMFTLSDWQTIYCTTNHHSEKRRMFEVLKPKIWQTRNGAVKHIDEVDLSKKDRNHFVYNASVTKGLMPLLYNVWPVVKQYIPDAHLTVIGGYYRFREGAEPDEQEKTLNDLRQDQKYKDLAVTFTGVIKQSEIATILANASFMIYPTDFPETFGISTLESLLYRTPSITNRFGALEETAVDMACYKVDYSSVKNVLYPLIDELKQTNLFIKQVLDAYNTPYLLQQKQNYCDVLNDIHSWGAVARQWRQHFYYKLKMFLPANDYREVKRINDKVSRIFNRRFHNPEDLGCYHSFGAQRRILVVSPFYNSEKYIEDCILSVAQQDYDNYHHVLIDDASTDNGYQIAKQTIEKLPSKLRDKFTLIKNKENCGAVYNQVHAIEQRNADIVMLLDGDDHLINNNTIFHFYNDIYDQGYEFTYGSCWSQVDNIPLIAQDYPAKVKEEKSYRQHRFNWNMPYTHLRTFARNLANNLDHSQFKDDQDQWLRAGADGSLFYELIERADPNKILAVKEVVYNYNDCNPLNDYKVNSNEQTRNANLILSRHK